MKFLVLLLLAFPFYASAISPDYSLVSYCTLYNNAGKKIATYPGRYCIFLPDGKIISAGNDSLALIGPKEVHWKIPLVVHHLMNLSADGKKILALTTETRKTEKGRQRVDKFAIISLEGKILHEADTLELMKDKLTYRDMTDISKERYKADYELTHFNSIAEIPPNSSKLSFMKAGNIVVNALSLGACVLTPDLQTVLDCRTFPSSRNHFVHDVKITDKGEYFFLNNEMEGEKIPASSVDIWDPVKRKLTFQFKANPVGMFYTAICGSVQFLDNDLMMASHTLAGLYFIDRKTGKLVETLPYHWMNPFPELPVQRFEAVKVESFLKMRQSEK